MRYWVEVTSGLKMEGALNSTMAIYAPLTTRYQNQFSNVERGDIVLHYMTTSLTKRDWMSSIVGVSTIDEHPRVVRKKIIAQCSRTTIFPVPIHLKSIKAMKNKSDYLEKLLNVNMQQYLSEISQSDFIQIMALNSENKKLLLERGLL